MKLYLISAGPRGPIKIGISENPRARLAALQTGNPDMLTLFAEFNLGKESRAAEIALHDELSHWRLNGEWFNLDQDFMTDYMPDFILGAGHALV